MEDLREPSLPRQANVAEGLIKASDRTPIHLCVGTVAAMQPHHGGLISESG
jgi:hypothetical protein